MVKCSRCGFVERADQILEKELGESFEGVSVKELEELMKKHGIKCPKCGGAFEEVTTLNLMFDVEFGVLDNVSRAYLRPETAQLPYVNFKREYAANREKLPFGLCVIGKAFRNEISPRRAFFRMREFTQAECQIFFNPKALKHDRFSEVKDYKVRVVLAGEREKGEQVVSCKELVEKGYDEFFVYYLARMQQFFESLGLPLEKFRFYEKNEEERAFYNKLHFDAEFYFPMFGSYLEVAGFHYRGDHDLSAHERESGENLKVLKDGEKFVPHVLELSFGVDRCVFALIDNGFTKRDGKNLLKLDLKVVPYEIAVFPLMKKDGLDEKARQVYEMLYSDFEVVYDDSGSIGKRYARVDEIGVPFAVTVDYESLEDDTVTVRNRDTAQQERIKITDLGSYFSKRFNSL